MIKVRVTWEWRGACVLNGEGWRVGCVGGRGGGGWAWIRGQGRALVRGLGLA